MRLTYLTSTCYGPPGLEVLTVDEAREAKLDADHAERRRYVSPRLEVYGDLTRLTMGGDKGGNDMESGPDSKIGD